MKEIIENLEKFTKAKPGTQEYKDYKAMNTIFMIINTRIEKYYIEKRKRLC